jgi:peptide/nickel transport system substrate-binding protein
VGAGRTLVMIARGEPTNLGAVQMSAAGPAGREVARLFFATLDFADERGNAQPYLQEAVPQLNTDSWRVFPDGRMETTYRLRPNLTWHDGTPLAAEDFVFGWRVYSTPSMGVAASPPMSHMEEVLAADPRTITIRWKTSYPDAARLMERFSALPRHILEPVFREGDVEALANNAYWTQQYVGLGPFKLDRWEPGAWIEAAAFDGHATGRPKIDRVKVVVATDANAALAVFLSGDAHVIVDNLVRTEDLPMIAGGGNAVLTSPLSFRTTQVQLRPEMGALRELADPRARAAIAHSMDKHGINEALYSGKAVVTDTMVSPLFDYYPTVEPLVVKHPYDPRRAQQLLDEAGLSRGADGFYVGLGGQSLTVEVGTTQSAVNEAENAIHRERLKQIGLNTTTFVLTLSMMRDNQAVTTFAGIFATGRVGGEEGIADYSTTNIPRTENRWIGGNRGGWSNAEYDRLFDAYSTTLARPERIQHIAQMERLVSEEVPTIPLLYTPRMIAHVPSLRGPTARASRDAMELIYVDRWEWAR